MSQDGSRGDIGALHVAVGEVDDVVNAEAGQDGEAYRLDVAEFPAPHPSQSAPCSVVDTIISEAAEASWGSPHQPPMTMEPSTQMHTHMMVRMASAEVIRLLVATCQAS